MTLSRPIRVLHLISDHRWTGPAEPLVNLVWGLREKGVEAALACRRAPKPRLRTLQGMAARRGIDPILDFHLNRYWPSFQTLRDLRRLPAYLDERSIDFVHTHLSHDHALGGYAARRCNRRVLVVRTNHKGVPLRRSRLQSLAFRRFTDAYVGFSRMAADQDQRTFGIPDDRVYVINPAVDLDRFDPTKPYMDVRGQLSLRPEDVIGGVVARVQRHRRWEILLRAIKLAVQRAPRLRFLIIGKGSWIEAVAKKPVAAMGLSHVVMFPGYRADDYVDYLNSLDFKVFLKPGSDGTCRAVREAMAMGKPVISSRRGMLPELIPHEKAGLVIDDTSENLADAMIRLVDDIALRNRLGDGARQHALRHFRLDEQVEAVAAMYEQLMGVKDRSHQY